MKKRLLNEFFIITISQAVLLSLVSWQRKKKAYFLCSPSTGHSALYLLIYTFIDVGYH